jgi:hypothetical protein
MFQVVEVLLKSWYSEDKRKLADVCNGDITVSSTGLGFIHPKTWHQVVKPDMTIWFNPHSISDEKEPEKPAESAGPSYENKVRYTVSYFDENSRNKDSIYLGECAYDERVDFEMADDDNTMPALEEDKHVTTPRESDEIEARDLKAKPTLGPRDRVTSISLTVNSSYLLNVLKSIIEYTTESPDGEQYGLGLGVFDYPYADLYYHMEDLVKYTTDSAGLRTKHSAAFNRKCDEHIDLLMQYLTSQRTIPVEECKKRWGAKIPVVAFATYWLLLKPGTDVYVREDDGSLNAYIVHEVEGGVTNVGGKVTNNHYDVSAWNLVFDGKQITPRLRHVIIGVFDNEREVTSLAMFPTRFKDKIDGGRLKEKLVNRGKRYAAYSKQPSFVQYSGKGLKNNVEVIKLLFPSISADLLQYKRARAVVTHQRAPWMSEDFVSSHLSHLIPFRDTTHIRESIRVPRCECKDCTAAVDIRDTYALEKFSGYHAIQPNGSTETTEHQHMFAFVLKERTYGEFVGNAPCLIHNNVIDLLDVYGLEPPNIAETAIDSLVMDRGNKDLIKAIAQTYTDSNQSDRFSADFIHGKGEGQIILLHGPPGTGKTLTAGIV